MRLLDSTHWRYHPYLTFHGQSYTFHKPVDSIDLVFAPPNQPIVCGIQRTANAIETAWYAHQQGSKNWWTASLDWIRCTPLIALWLVHGCFNFAGWWKSLECAWLGHDLRAIGSASLCRVQDLFWGGTEYSARGWESEMEIKQPKIGGQEIQR